MFCTASSTIILLILLLFLRVAKESFPFSLLFGSDKRSFGGRQNDGISIKEIKTRKRAFLKFFTGYISPWKMFFVNESSKLYECVETAVIDVHFGWILLLCSTNYHNHTSIPESHLYRKKRLENFWAVYKNFDNSQVWIPFCDRSLIFKYSDYSVYFPCSKISSPTLLDDIIWFVIFWSFNASVVFNGPDQLRPSCFSCHPCVVYSLLEASADYDTLVPWYVSQIRKASYKHEDSTASKP